MFGQKVEGKSERVISLNMYKSIVYAGGATSATNTFGLSSFSPSVRWGIENNDFHELELTNLNLLSRKYSFAFDLGIVYNYNWKVLDLGNNKTQFYFGTGFEPIIDLNRNYPIESVSFSSSSTKVGVNLSIAAKLKWNISDNFFVNISVPYNYYTSSYEYIKDDNPNIPSEQRKTTASSSKVFPNDFTVKVGVGIKF